ncbi:GNAT family N-acetyltransferase [Fictibacillus sp. B-59209]|uniref:GNAT family N-acetyltransferase n=1 Tax=Fictibacillus sp. B-59209 TaxID=3024873 RepID=UPI002E1A9D3B|nr:GNAT family N-acetyltransferase [Fictibacillus sp. B-59209]
MEEWTKESYVISMDKKSLNIDLIHEYLTKESYWAQGITRERVQKAVDHSLCFGVYEKNGDDQTQVGFARIVTDYVATAYVCDVFILDPHRGKGLSKWLIETITSHKELQEVRGMLLVTKDAHGLYSQYGFQPVEAEKYMKKEMKREEQPPRSVMREK